MAGIIMLALVGAASGFFIKQFLRIRLGEKQAMALGALGALLGAGLLGLVLPVAAKLIAAAGGAAFVIWAVERYRNRVL